MAKKKKAKRAGKSLFKVASQNKAFRAATRAKNKAQARAKAAWKKALSVAKKKIRKSK